MPMIELNYLAVLAAAAASFVFGAIFYGVMAKPWMAAIGRTEDEVKAGASPVIYVITAICQIVLAFMLAAIMAHFGPDAITVKNGILSALLLWAGFVATTMIVNHRFQGQPWALTVIDGAHWLGGMVIQGVVIGLIGA